MEKLINVITRTSNRPKGFDRNYQSVKNQSHKNIKHIVTYDNQEDYDNYLSKYDDIEKFQIDRQNLIDNYQGPFFYNKMFWPSYHNLYFNPVLQTINDGWIIFLDDDNFFYDQNSVSNISSHLNDPDKLYVWKMQPPNNQTIPRPESFQHKVIKIGDIDTGCIAFHSKWAKSCQWDGFKCGDFRFIHALSKVIPNSEWIDKVFVVVPSVGFGQRVDI
jgi:hypothetical protein